MERKSAEKEQATDEEQWIGSGKCDGGAFRIWSNGDTFVTDSAVPRSQFVTKLIEDLMMKQDSSYKEVINKLAVTRGYGVARYEAHRSKCLH